jgi:hypothetical protein
MNHPELQVKNPWVNGYPQVFLMMDLHGYSQVYPWVSMLKSRNKHIFHIQILQGIGTTLSHKYCTTIGLRVCHLHGLLLLLGPFGLILKKLNDTVECKKNECAYKSLVHNISAEISSNHMK